MVFGFVEGIAKIDLLEGWLSEQGTHAGADSVWSECREVFQMRCYTWDTYGPNLQIRLAPKCSRRIFLALRKAFSGIVVISFPAKSRVSRFVMPSSLGKAVRALLVNRSVVSCEAVASKALSLICNEAICGWIGPNEGSETFTYPQNTVSCELQFSNLRRSKCLSRNLSYPVRIAY